jgi:hypothetical protein
MRALGSSAATRPIGPSRHPTDDALHGSDPHLTARQQVVVKESAVSGGAATMGLLQSAELRGAVMAALGAIVPIETKSKAAISKTFGDRNVDDYVKDNEFWKKEVAGIDLRIGSREAVMILLAARKGAL